MASNLSNQNEQANRQRVDVTKQPMGVSDEAEYLVRREAEYWRKLTEERQAKVLVEERERARAGRLMKCPKCGMQLEEIYFGDVRVDKCFSCRGVWLYRA